MANVNVISDDKQQLSPPELVEKGLAAHQKGDLDSAACLYQAAIELDNYQSDALHLLGMVAFQLDQPEKAEQLILLAIKNNSEVPVYFNNLGNIYLSSGSFSLAIEAYQRAVKLKEDYFEAKFNLANAYVEFEDYGLAEIFYLRALENAPEFVPALKNLGELYVAQQKWNEAFTCYENLNNLEPGNQEYHQRLEDLKAVLAGKIEIDENDLRQAIEDNPGDMEAQLVLANHLVNNGQTEEAKTLYDNVIAQDESSAEAYFGKATLLKQVTKLEEALVYYQKAIDSKPNYLDAMFNLANTHKALGNLDDAVAAYEDVLSIDSQHIGAMINLAVVFSWQGGFSDSLILLKSAESIEPENYILQNNLGMVHHLLRNYDIAKEHYQKALAIKDDPEAKWNLSLTLLAQGDLAQGFALYESRWDLPDMLASVKKDLPYARWQGENVDNKSILVHFEQGYGDALQFARFVPKLINRGAKVTLEMPVVLQSLMKTLDARVNVVTKVSESDVFDYHCPIMSLAHCFETNLDTVPNQVPYFKVNEVTDLFTENPENQLNIGVVWAGNPRENNIQTSMIDKRRSCDLSYFESLSDIKDVKIFSLQHDQCPGYLSKIVDVMDAVGDFKDTAEIIQGLDLVISVDTAVAHLAGALNKPVWLLSRYDSCWRWLADREDSPWYPSMRIFRQPEPGDWQSVFSQVREALIALDKPSR